MKIRVKAKPNSRVEAVKQIENDYYEIKVSVPPEKGKANKRIIELLSKHLKIPKSNITIIRGEASKEKIFNVI